MRISHAVLLSTPCSQWYQYKLMHRQQHSTLSNDREHLLSDVGFIWDSHAACWLENSQSLRAFFMWKRHCSVPIDSKEGSLNIWCKHQRRQFKIFREGLSSTMTEERFQKLESLNLIGILERDLKSFSEMHMHPFHSWGVVEVPLSE
jgi:Helicase associated domain